MEVGMSTQTYPVTLIRRPFLNGWERSESPTTTSGGAVEKLDINVIYTTPKGTLAALRTARELAHDLWGRIRLLAPQAVPLGFSLSQPPVDIGVTERHLLELVRHGPPDQTETIVQLYLCRDRLDTLGQVLRPNSLVVIGGKRWWPNEASYIAKLLRSVGHHVIFVPPRAPDKRMHSQQTNARPVEARS
jgi:hypothetical protein